MKDGDCNVCISGGYDGDSPDFFSEAKVKARKPYKCCECHAEIAIGQNYQRSVGKWDGKLSTYRTCLPCAEIRDAFCCDGSSFSQLWESMSEELFDSMTTGCLSKLKTAAAKDKLLARWRKWKFT